MHNNTNKTSTAYELGCLARPLKPRYQSIVLNTILTLLAEQEENEYIKTKLEAYIQMANNPTREGSA